MLKGLKTYAVAGVAIISAVLAYLTGQLTLVAALEAVGLALGLGGNRLLINAAAILNGPYRSARLSTNLNTRAAVTYLGVALTILTAIVAGLNGDQDSVTVIGSILAALGLSFLGLGAKKVATGDEPVAVK
jgi:hypothetical protein